MTTISTTPPDAHVRDWIWYRAKERDAEGGINGRHAPKSTRAWVRAGARTDWKLIVRVWGK